MLQKQPEYKYRVGRIMPGRDNAAQTNISKKYLSLIFFLSSDCQMERDLKRIFIDER
jgi:hypothetical protein